MLIFDNKHYTHSNVNITHSNSIINIIHTVMLIFDNKHYTHSNVNI